MNAMCKRCIIWITIQSNIIQIAIQIILRNPKRGIIPRLHVANIIQITIWIEKFCPV